MACKKNATALDMTCRSCSTVEDAAAWIPKKELDWILGLLLLFGVVNEVLCPVTQHPCRICDAWRYARSLSRQEAESAKEAGAAGEPREILLSSRMLDLMMSWNCWIVSLPCLCCSVYAAAVWTVDASADELATEPTDTVLRHQLVKCWQKFNLETNSSFLGIRDLKPAGAVIAVKVQ